MKKPHAFWELSDVKCSTCPKRLKKNVIARRGVALENGRPIQCYPCWTKKKTRERAEAEERRR